MESAKVQLISRHAFYAAVLAQCAIKWTSAIPTAGVRITATGNPELLVNREFWSGMSDEHKLGILMHEMLHLLLNHTFRGKDLNLKVMNVAADIAINQLIPPGWLPEGHVTHGMFKLAAGEATEYYYNELMKNPEQCNGAPSFDEHLASECDPDLEAEIVRDMIAKGKTAGAMHAGVEKEIEKAQKAKQVDWKTALRHYIGRSRSLHTESTRTKPNRRQGFMATGQKNLYTPKMLIAIDQSGSISDEAASALLAEAKGILSIGAREVVVAYFDTQITATEKLDKAVFKRHSYGGTDFNCIFEYATKNRQDLIIILTDGEASTPSIKLKTPVLWIGLPGSKLDHLTGKKIVMEK